MLENQTTPDPTTGVSCVNVTYYADNGSITPSLTETKMIKLENVSPWHLTVHAKMRVEFVVYGKLETLDHKFELSLAPTEKVSLYNDQGEILLFSSVTETFFFDADVANDTVTTTSPDHKVSTRAYPVPLLHPNSDINYSFIDHPSREPNFDKLIKEAINQNRNVVIAVDQATALEAYYFYETLRTGIHSVKPASDKYAQIDAMEDRRIMIYHHPPLERGYATYFPHDVNLDLFLTIVNALNDNK